MRQLPKQLLLMAAGLLIIILGSPSLINILVWVHYGVLVAWQLACDGVDALLEEVNPSLMTCPELCCFLVLRVQLIKLAVKQVHGCCILLPLVRDYDETRCSSCCPNANGNAKA